MQIKTCSTSKTSS